MKVAYVFATHMATTFKLATMVLPQLEQGRHGATVVRAANLVEGVVAGCFPQLYGALAGSPPNYVITL